MLNLASRQSGELGKASRRDLSGTKRTALWKPKRREPDGTDPIYSHT